MNPFETIFADIRNRQSQLKALHSWISVNFMALCKFDKLRLEPTGQYLTCEVPEAGLPASALPALDYGTHRSDAWPTQLRAGIPGTGVTLVVSCADRLVREGV